MNYVYSHNIILIPWLNQSSNYYYCTGTHTTNLFHTHLGSPMTAPMGRAVDPPHKLENPLLTKTCTLSVFERPYSIHIHEYGYILPYRLFT